MKRLVKTMGTILSLLFMLMVISLFLPDKAYQRAVIHFTKVLTERDLHIGSLTIQRGLQTSIELSDVSFANAQGFERESMVEAKKLTASINLRALLQGVLEISSLSSTELGVYLETNTAGEPNWQLSKDTSFRPEFSRIRLIELSAKNSTLDYVDPTTAIHHSFALEALALHLEEDDGNPLLSARGEFNGLPLTVDAYSTPSDQRSQPNKEASPTQIPFRIEARINDIIVSADGDTDVSSGNVVINSNLSAKVDNLHKLATLIQVVMPTHGASVAKDRESIDSTLTGQAHISSTVSVRDKQLDIQLYHAELALNQHKLQVSGKITDALDSATTGITLQLNTPDMSLITLLSRQKMPPEWGPVSASAELIGSHGQYAMKNILAVLSGNSTAKVSGSIGKLIPVSDMQLAVEASLFDLAEVSVFTPNPLPDMGPFSGEGTVVWQNGRLSLADAKASYTGPLGFAVVTGGIGDLIRFDKVRLRADADLPDFTALDLFTGFTMPAVDGVVVSTNLFSTQTKDLSARNLKLTVRKDDVTVSAEGSVDSIIKNKAQLDLNLTTSLESFTQLDGLLGRTLPDIGPVNTTARLQGSGSDIKLVDVHATVDDDWLNAIVQNGCGLPEARGNTAFGS